MLLSSFRRLAFAFSVPTKTMSAIHLVCFALPLSPLPTPRRAMPAAVKLRPPREPHAFSRAAVAASRNRCRPFFRCMAADGSAEVGNGVPKSVPVAVAHELLKSGHQYLDVRTVEEFSAGHAVGAVNIPYMLKSGLGMVKNANFLQEVSSTFEKDDEIIVGCLGGKRSLMAASELGKAGFTAITDVEGGYSAWVQNGLPTEK